MSPAFGVNTALHCAAPHLIFANWRVLVDRSANRALYRSVVIVLGDVFLGLGHSFSLAEPVISARSGT
jgi:hypothetical protein